MTKLNAISRTDAVPRSSDDDDAKEAPTSANIVRFDRHWFTPDGRMFQIYELCPHGTLRQLLDSNEWLTPLQTLQCVRQICCGLTVAHSTQVIHLDLKPDNILVSADHVLKISDFGISIDLDVVAQCEERKFAFSGDATYIAPEVLQNLNHTLTDDINVKTDIFSLGLVFLEMICNVTLKKHDARLHELRNDKVDFVAIIGDKFKDRGDADETDDGDTDESNDGDTQDTEECGQAAAQIPPLHPADADTKRLCTRMLRHASSHRPSASQARSEIDRIVAQHGLIGSMCGFRSLFLPTAESPKPTSSFTTPQAKGIPSSTFHTPAASGLSKTASRVEFHQQCFVEQPLKNYDDVQSARQRQQMMKGAPALAFTPTRTPARFSPRSPFTPSPSAIDVQFSPSPLASRQWVQQPAKINRSLSFGTPTMSTPARSTDLHTPPPELFGGFGSSDTCSSPPQDFTPFRLFGDKDGSVQDLS